MADNNDDNKEEKKEEKKQEQEEEKEKSNVLQFLSSHKDTNNIYFVYIYVASIRRPR